jgi:predicted amidohydrolase YtcJ
MPRSYMGILLMLFVCLNSYAQKADIVLINGKVFTSNQKQLYVEAVAIKGNKIMAVGRTADIQQLSDPRTHVIDLKGKTVVPGFNDAHFHHRAYPSGYTILYPEDGSEPTWQQLSDSIVSVAKRIPAGTFIIATMGNNVGTDTSINRFVLDKLAPSHPLVIDAYWGHVTYFNSAAIKPLGMSETEPDVKGGIFGRIPGTGKVNGRAFEYACDFIRNQVPTTVELFDASLKDLGQQAAYFGVTTIQNMCTGGEPAKYVQELMRTSMPVRFRLIRWNEMNPDGSLNIPSVKLPVTNSKLPLVSVSGSKWMLDGTPIERLAWYSTDYKDQPGWKGRMDFTKAEVQLMLRELQARKDQPMFHVVGDSTTDFVLHELNKSPAAWKNRRVRFEHGDGLMPASYKSAKDLNIIVVQNPSHFMITDVLPQRFGPKLMKDSQPMKSLLKAGIPVAIGSDGPLNPYLNIMFACIHPLRPHEALTVEEAVIAYTKTSGYAEMRDDKGMLAPGQLADLVVLSQDIFSVPLQALPGTYSLLTMVDGKIILNKF